MLKLLARVPSGLAVAGAGLAAASASFAVYMVAYTPRDPYFGGIEHLALFAQPSGARPPAVPAPLDMTPVGSIGRALPSGPSTPGPVSVVRDHVLLGLSGTRALIGTPSGPFLFGRGDEITGLGRVISMERSGGSWSVLTEGGRIVEQPSMSR